MILGKLFEEDSEASLENSWADSWKILRFCCCSLLGSTGPDLLFSAIINLQTQTWGQFRNTCKPSKILFILTSIQCLHIAVLQWTCTCQCHTIMPVKFNYAIVHCQACSCPVLSYYLLETSQLQVVCPVARLLERLLCSRWHCGRLSGSVKTCLCCYCTTRITSASCRPCNLTVELQAAMLRCNSAIWPRMARDWSVLKCFQRLFLKEGILS